MDEGLDSLKKTTHKRVRKQLAEERPVFDAIRKPLAPPGHALSQAKPDERARPAGRKAKHKMRVETTDGDAAAGR
jgi:hypothetical protein